MHSVTKGFSFDMGHRLTFHSKCYNLHGHTYRLEVRVAGPLDSDGIVLDFAEVKRLVRELVVDRLDHAFLCYSGDALMRAFLETTDFKAVQVDFETTAENLAEWIYHQLRQGDLNVVRVRLYETPNSWADYAPTPEAGEAETPPTGGPVQAPVPAEEEGLPGDFGTPLPLGRE